MPTRWWPSSSQRLLGLVDPDDGAPVVDAVIRRAEVASQDPLRGSGAPSCSRSVATSVIELSDTVAASSVLTDHRDRPWGYHHQDGVFIGAGPAFVDGSLPRALGIVDVLPTAFTVAELPVPDGSRRARSQHEILTVDERGRRTGLREGVAEPDAPGARILLPVLGGGREADRGVAPRAGLHRVGRATR